MFTERFKMFLHFLFSFVPVLKTNKIKSAIIDVCMYFACVLTQ